MSGMNQKALRAALDMNDKIVSLSEQLSTWKTRAEKAEARLSHESSPCVLCGVGTNNLAGNPALWPMYFPHKDSDGVCLTHCSGCIAGLIADCDEWKRLYHALEESIEANIDKMDAGIIEARAERDTLKARCEKLEGTSPISERAADGIAEAIFNALDKLPEQGWVHGNTFLPANVLCDVQGKYGFINLIKRAILSYNEP